MNKIKLQLLSVFVIASLLLAGFSANVVAGPQAATAPGLGAADGFSVLAGVSASSANTSTLAGNLGLDPGLESDRTGVWVVNGTEYFGPSTLAHDAQASALGAFNNLAGQGSNGLWSGATAPVPGVWSSGSSETFSGTLTLTGGYDDVWVFQIPASLTFGGSVVMAGNAQECNVFWQVGESATIESGSSFIGTLIASTSVTVVSGANVSGRIIALNGSVTLDNNTISMPRCASAPVYDTPSGGEAAATATAVVGGLPSTGGAPLQSETLPWLMAVLFGGLSVAVLVLIVRALRRSNRQ